MPQCIGIVGGRPSSSLYFIGFQEENIVYLDPHHVQAVRRGKRCRSSFGCARSRDSARIARCDLFPSVSPYPPPRRRRAPTTTGGRFARRRSPACPSAPSIRPWRSGFTAVPKVSRGGCSTRRNSRPAACGASRAPHSALPSWPDPSSSLATRAPLNPPPLAFFNPAQPSMRSYASGCPIWKASSEPRRSCPSLLAPFLQRCTLSANRRPGSRTTCPRKMLMPKKMRNAIRAPRGAPRASPPHRRPAPILRRRAPQKGRPSIHRGRQSRRALHKAPRIRLPPRRVHSRPPAVAGSYSNKCGSPMGRKPLALSFAGQQEDGQGRGGWGQQGESGSVS